MCDRGLDRIDVQANIVADFVEPVDTILVGFDRANSTDRGSVELQFLSLLIPALTKRIVGKNHLSGRKPRDIPPLRRGGRRHRVRGKTRIKTSVGEERNLVEDQGRMDLVAEHESVILADQLAERTKFSFVQNTAGRIPRVAENHEARASLKTCFDALQVERPTLVTGPIAVKGRNLDDGVASLSGH